jgi:hypothetical protein
MNKLDDSYSEDDFPMEIDVGMHSTKDGEEDTYYFTIYNIGSMQEINRLAAELYATSGRIFLPDSDFYGSRHPEEQGCFYKACLAFCYIEEIQKEKGNE